MIGSRATYHGQDAGWQVIHTSVSLYCHPNGRMFWIGLGRRITPQINDLDILKALRIQMGSQLLQHLLGSLVGHQALANAVCIQVFTYPVCGDTGTTPSDSGIKSTQDVTCPSGYVCLPYPSASSISLSGSACNSCFSSIMTVFRDRFQ